MSQPDNSAAGFFPAAVAWDLDGTLVDSAPGILSAFGHAFAVCGIAPVIPPSATEIGPPLRTTLERLAGAPDPQVLDRLTAAFTAHYDNAGLLETEPYPGVQRMLEAIAGNGLRLYIATNKRDVPTRRILMHLGWDRLFERVYALDTFAPPLTDKSALLARLVADAGLQVNDCSYVGDRPEDALAARVNRLAFYWAGWGYGAAPPHPQQAVQSRLLWRPDARKLLDMA